MTASADQLIERYTRHLGDCRVCRGMTDQDPDSCVVAIQLWQEVERVRQLEERDLYCKDGRGRIHVLPPGSNHMTVCGLDTYYGFVPIEAPAGGFDSDKLPSGVTLCRTCFDGRL